MLNTKLEIDLTYLEDDENGEKPFPEVITFFAGAYLQKDFADRMQKHFALKEEEKLAAAYDYNVEVIGQLVRSVKKPPVGLPGFEPGEDWKESLQNYFAEKTEALDLLAQAIVDVHYGKTQRYSFRG
jgi:hypothetical protein